MDLNKTIKDIVYEIMGINIEELDKNKEINTISEWDSFNNLMLISKFQDELNVEFTTIEIENVLKVEDLYELIKKKINENE